MKKQIVVVVAVLVFAASAFAQQSPAFTLRAHIPFDFMVQGTTLPAGDYMLQIPSLNVGPMALRQVSGTKTAYVLKAPDAEKWTGNAQLKFDQLGGAYHLVSISDPRFGTQTVKIGERYKIARNTTPTETVVAAK